MDSRGKRGNSVPLILRSMPTLATTVDGLKLPNPFLIASGPPGTNFNVISRAFREGWGGVVAKTVSLDASKVINVSPATVNCTLPMAGRWLAGRISSLSATALWRSGWRNLRSARTPSPIASSSPRSWRSFAAMPGSRSSSAARRRVLMDLNSTFPALTVCRAKDGLCHGGGPRHSFRGL